MAGRTNTKSHLPPLYKSTPPMNRKKPPFSPSPHPLLISMAIISILFISLLIFTHPTTTTTTATATVTVHHHYRHPPSTKPSSSSSSDLIQQACKATRYQQLCESSLSIYPNRNAIEIIQSVLTVSYNNLRQAQSIAIDPRGGRRRSRSDHRREELLRASAQLRPPDQIDGGCGATRRDEERSCLELRRVSLPVRQYDCWSALKYVNYTKMIDKTMSFLNRLIGYTSNALSLMMADDVYGDQTASWRPPVTERKGFWEGGGGGGGGSPELGVPAGLKADVTVCKGGGCDHTTVQGAVDAAPEWSSGRRFVIWVKAGVYEETVRVGLEKQNVVVLGDGMGKTVITGSLNVGQPGLSTYNTATFGVVGDGFMASGLTIENTAGPDAHQAVAFRSDSDQSIIENCEFLGNQDTLYAHSLRQFYKSCHIQGNVDFIFGNSASIFHNCTILVRPRQLKPEKGENNAITAHGRIDPAQSTGFVFHNCLINGTESYMKLYYSKPKVHKNFLGRPWKEFSRTVFVECYLEALITPQGWMPWKGDFALKTLYYGEFGNNGKGSDLAGRVNWSSRIPADHVGVYTVGNFLQGDQWRLASS